MKKKIKIGILDDDTSKVTQIITQLLYGMQEASKTKIDKYREYEFEPYEISIDLDIDEMIDFIRKNKIECVLVDYNLSSYANISFTGVQFAKCLESTLLDFPVFILTAYEDELYEQEVFNAYQVFDFTRYLSESEERIELNYKIIEQVLKYYKQIESWKGELKRLLPASGKSSEIDDRILYLDTMIEKSIDAEKALPDRIKRELQVDRVDELMKKIDKLLEED
ncbi:hypothetical protein C8E03_103218 [Lachnotalea glycerini]|uniref:Response regulator n=1 Tax=Lachnotalea glycerini TaxID=1763509 RepID=A0A318ETY4_9FIRM|nr:hypothetical protein [Lachnotalea glycerini]PXV91660.1 hypothetical protein C8E03_103218 [Lachnotalea glycerini]